MMMMLTLNSGLESRRVVGVEELERKLWVRACAIFAALCGVLHPARKQEHIQDYDNTETNEQTHSQDIFSEISAVAF